MRRRALSHRYGHLKRLCPTGSRIQVVLFPKGRFTVAQAKAWASKEGLKHGDVDTHGEFIHLRQEDPSHFQRIRTVPFGSHGIKARVGWSRC